MEQFEWDWGRDLEIIDKELDQELKKIDKLDETIDWEKVQNDNKIQFEKMLKSSFGQDIKDVTSGRIKVKLPLRIRFKRWIERIFRIFG